MPLRRDNILALIPARGGSKGIPGKNIIDFCGKPLISWSIEQASGSKYIRDVYVTSDDDDILRVSENSGAIAIKRPGKLATATASTESALMHAINCIDEKGADKIDAIVFLQATSPLRTAKDIDDSIDLFISKKADSLFSGTVLDDFCIWALKGNKFSSLTYDYKNRGRRQEREPFFLENGSIYIFKPSILKRYNNRLGGKIEFFSMPIWKSYEIDKPEDLEICAYFMKNNILKAR